MSPAGKPSFEDTPLSELARRHTEAAVKVLADCLESGTERAKLEAAETLLDRGWGKVAAAGPTSSPAQLVRDAFDELPFDDLATLRGLIEILRHKRQGKA